MQTLYAHFGNETPDAIARSIVRELRVLCGVSGAHVRVGPNQARLLGELDEGVVVVESGPECDALEQVEYESAPVPARHGWALPAPGGGVLVLSCESVRSPERAVELAHLLAAVVRLAAIEHERERRVLALEAIQAELTEQNVVLQELAVVDELTGLYNRRFLERRLAYEVDRAQRYGRPLALAMIDLDFFRLVNERYGHPGGDAVLVGFARIAPSTIRGSDILMRYGGEEFTLLMPETTIEMAARAAERLRGAVEANIVTFGPDEIKVTCSIGVASYRAGAAMTAAQFIARGDAALYRSKHEGRNRATVLDASVTPDVAGGDR